MAKDIFQNIGKVKINQSRDTGNLDSGETAYIINTVLSDPINFSAIISAKKPQNLFLYEGQTFIRMVSLDEFNEYPPDYPTENNGYYRRAEASKSFSSEITAASYAHALYEAVTKFMLVLYDYEATLNNVTEEDIVPNQDRSTLYNTIVAYEAVRDRITEKDKEIATAKAVLAMFEEIISVEDLTSTIAEPEKAPEKLNLVSINLRGINARLLAVNTNPSSSLKTISNKFKDYNPLKNLETRVSDTTTAFTSQKAAFNNLKSKWEVIKNNNPSVDPVDMDTAIGEVLSRNMDVTSNLSGIESSRVAISQDMGIYLPAIETAANAITDATDTVSADISLVDSNVATIDKGLKIKAINHTKLQDLYTQYQENITILEDERNSLITEKQKYAATLTSLEPSIDLTDPMTIYTHRIFKRPVE